MRNINPTTASMLLERHKTTKDCLRSDILSAKELTFFSNLLHYQDTLTLKCQNNEISEEEYEVQRQNENFRLNKWLNFLNTYNDRGGKTSEIATLIYIYDFKTRGYSHIWFTHTRKNSIHHKELSEIQKEYDDIINKMIIQGRYFEPTEIEWEEIEYLNNKMNIDWEEELVFQTEWYCD